jgi:hypothetical protein
MPIDDSRILASATCSGFFNCENFNLGGDPFEPLEEKLDGRNILDINGDPTCLNSSFT